jgi:hypothetical protein
MNDSTQRLDNPKASDVLGERAKSNKPYAGVNGSVREKLFSSFSAGKLSLSWSQHPSCQGIASSLGGQDNWQFEAMPLPFDRDQHLIPWISRFHLGEKVIGILHGHAPDGDDQISTAPVNSFGFGHEWALSTSLANDLESPHPSMLSRPVRNKRGYEQSMIGLIDPRHAGIRTNHLPPLDELGHDSRNRPHRNGESDPGALPGAAGNGGVHSDQQAGAVEERPARISWIDGGIGLNDRLDGPAVSGRE